MSAPRRITYLEPDGDRTFLTCPACGQTARADMDRDKVTVRCFAGCSTEDTLAGIDRQRLLAELQEETTRRGCTGPARGERAARADPIERGSERWFESAADLLREPDPGPTPFLVKDLIVEAAVAAIQGPPKVSKSWVMLELAVSVVTGKPAFDRFRVERPGPVLVVMEESGRAPFQRRLESLRRGYDLDPDALTGLHFAANRRVQLVEKEWQARLLEAAHELHPRAIFLDPLVRMKGAATDENDQRDMAPVLDFMRDLREASRAAVPFVHHVGHEGGHLRGTSDLEAYWESKVTVGREPGGVRTLTAEHRESEATPSLRYRLAWHEQSGSLRLDALDAPPRSLALLEKITEWVKANADQSTDAVAKGVSHRRADVARVLETGPFTRPSGRRDGSGRRGGWVFAERSENGTRPALPDGSGRADGGDGGEPSPLPLPSLRDGGVGTDDHAGPRTPSSGDLPTAVPRPQQVWIDPEAPRHRLRVMAVDGDEARVRTESQDGQAGREGAVPLSAFGGSGLRRVV